MELNFEIEERLVKVLQRAYLPEQLDFIKKKCDEFLEVGYIYSNNSSKWAYDPLIVPKERPEKFRFTVDLRALHA